MEAGTVKWFDNAKGWGFIVDPNGKDIFVHYREVQGAGYRTLKKGQEVRYERCSGDRGVYAARVEVLTTSESGEVPAQPVQVGRSFPPERASGVVARPGATGGELQWHPIVSKKKVAG